MSPPARPWPPGAFPHPAVGAVKGANEKLNIAVLGPGGRAQEHLRILLRMKNEEQKPVDIIGLCDVWDGNDAGQARALLLGREVRPGLPEGKDKDRVTKDYRRILDCKDVDVVLIATPDHWHAKMSIDAMEAGKDVYCEKPMTHTIDEARRVAETAKKTKQVFTVGVQSTADPRWQHGQPDDHRGQDRPRHAGPDQLLPQQRRRPVAVLPAHQGHEPQDRRLEDVPGDRVRPGPRHAVQPRQVRPVALLLGLRRRHVHRPVRPPAHPPDPGDGRPVPAAGRRRRRPLSRIRRPRRARRGHRGRRLRRGLPGPHLGDDVQRRPARRGDPRPHRRPSMFEASPTARASASSSRSSRAGRPLRAPTAARAASKFNPQQPHEDTRALWEHFIECVRSRNPETLCPADLGYAAITTVNLGVQSYREGKAYYFDKATGEVCDADSAWAARWEERSHLRGKPNQVIGWKAGDEGSLLAPARATRSSKATGSTARIPAGSA